MKTHFFFIFPIIMFMSVLFFCFSLILFNLHLSIFIQWDLICSGFKLSFPIFFDFLSCMFMSIVFLISASILFYSNFYMDEDQNKIRFFYLMILFILSMIFLILSPNMVCMLLGWDGLGLVSYCLVIYYQNFKSFNAGMITALTNRVGDVFILGSISLCWTMGSWSYLNFDCLENKILIVFFLIAAMTKSAQIPFSSWLPAAMAAPTPVSSLVHSSTLVTAGVYILIRFFYLIEDTILESFFILISLLTMIMSGLNGIFEFDLKKIIALSTLSQLGFMMFTISMKMVDLSFFHLITHACFKALLFMCSGIFIHSFFDNQDIRFYGKLSKNFFLVLCMFNVANLSLCGFPFLSGFFSKDLILEMMIMKNTNFFIFFLALVGTFLTVMYSFRLFLFLTFKNAFFTPLSMNMNFFTIQKSLFFLYLFSISLGYFFSKLILFPYNFVIIPSSLKFLIIFICLLSFFICFFISSDSKIMNLNKNFTYFFSNMWFVQFLKTDFLKLGFFSLNMKVNNVSILFIEHFIGENFFCLNSYFSSKLNKALYKLFYMFFFFSFLMILFFSLLGF